MVFMDIKNLLKNVSLFSSLNETEIVQLSQIGSQVSMDANQIVFEEGAIENTLYVILEGLVKVFQNNQDGLNVEIAQLKEKEVFGMMALIDEKPRSASVITLEPCKFFIIKKDLFLDFISHSPQVCKKMLEALSHQIRDSNQKFLEIALKEEKIRTAAESERRKSITELVASVAHEMNTPIGIISNSASYISERLAENTIQTLVRETQVFEILSDIQTAVALIIKNSKKLDQLVKSFKNLSAKEMIGEIQKMNLKTLLEEAILFYKLSNKTTELDIQIQCDIPPNDLFWEGFSSPIFHIISNLLSNIDRYAYDKNARINKKVEITLTKETEWRKGAAFLITVRDYGHGISKENFSKIFTPFFTTGRDQGGIGLGLSIIYNLISHSLHGEIQADSTEGKGTAFYIHFPASLESFSGSCPNSLHHSK